MSFIFAGIAVGHVYYFLEDVFPEQPGGFRILRTPGILYEIYLEIPLHFKLNYMTCSAENKIAIDL